MVSRNPASSLPRAAAGFASRSTAAARAAHGSTRSRNSNSDRSSASPSRGVVYSPGRGYSTNPLLGLAELRARFEFRLLVEPWAARAAAVDRLANPAAALGKELAGFRETMATAGDLRQDLVAHDTRFHDTILAASGNPVVRHAFAQTHCHLHTFRLYPADVDGAITVAEHSAVRDAIEACLPEQAEAAMAEHIRNSFDRFAQAFEGHAELSPLEDGGPPRKRIIS